MARLPATALFFFPKAADATLCCCKISETVNRTARQASLETRPAPVFPKLAGFASLLLDRRRLYDPVLGTARSEN